MIFITEIGTSLRVATSAGYDSVALTVSVNNTPIVSGMTSRIVNGYFEFFGLEAVIRSYMQLNNLTVLSITSSYATMTGTTAATVTGPSLSILYCEKEMIAGSTFTADYLVSNYFLTHYKVGWICRGCEFRLSYYVTSMTNITKNTYKKDGTSNTSGSRTNGLGYYTISWEDDVAYVTVSMGSRRFTVYFIDKPAGEQLRFKNTFNRWENVSFPASTDVKPSTEYETASLENVSVMYDIEHKLELEIKTAAIPGLMYECLNDLCHAHSVQRREEMAWESGTEISWRDVLITKYKLDKSTNPNTPLTMELTLEYANRKMNDAIVIHG